MFKAKIIEDKNYYSFKRKQLALLATLFIPLVFFICLFPLQLWIKSIMAMGYVYVAFMLFKSAKSIRPATHYRRIEISNKGIRIMGRNNKELESYEINELSEVTVMEEYRLPQENLREIIEEIFGKYQTNFIKFSYQKKSKQFNFEIDSIFMLKKLNEVISNWAKSGVKLNTIK
jgi:hypothetical protein